MSEKLTSYLADIDQRVQEMMDTIIEQMAELQGIAETLKAANQMEWIRRMNNIRATAKEIVRFISSN